MKTAVKLMFSLPESKFNCIDPGSVQDVSDVNYVKNSILNFSEDNWPFSFE